MPCLPGSLVGAPTLAQRPLCLCSQRWGGGRWRFLCRGQTLGCLAVAQCLIYVCVWAGLFPPHTPCSAGDPGLGLLSLRRQSLLTYPRPAASSLSREAWNVHLAGPGWAGLGRAGLGGGRGREDSTSRAGSGEAYVARAPAETLHSGCLFSSLDLPRTHLASVKLRPPGVRVRLLLDENLRLWEFRTHLG